MNFPTQTSDILQLIQHIDPIKYGKTRNFLNGSVTHLSPYISRGVLTTKVVAQTVLKLGYEPAQIETFLKELAWRDYFQRVWQSVGNKIHNDVKQTQQNVHHFEVPTSIIAAETGIRAIDRGIRSLYETGYMHNHMRMYVASVSCNIGKSHWLEPARWMYYHLLDADWGSNALSWQWVAGSFSSKKYFMNQENINKYSNDIQQDTFLDLPYDGIENMPAPKALKHTTRPELITPLPQTPAPNIDEQQPVYIYNFYNLDSRWESHVRANRILLLEPRFFELYPSGARTINFILSLAKNIPDIQIVVSNFEDLFTHEQYAQLHFKEHPTNRHYKGNEHARTWMFEQVNGFYPSFFSYWKNCQKHIDTLL